MPHEDGAFGELAIGEGIHFLPKGFLPAIAICLEMTERPDYAELPAPPGLTIRKIERPSRDYYLELFGRIGERWFWTSRRRMTPEQLDAILLHPAVELHVVEKDGRAEGIAELDRREPGETELAFFGLTEELMGQGVGRWLMQFAVTRAFSEPTGRLWLHTCNLDSPQALGFYQRLGFKPYRYALEMGPDPRIDGMFPRHLKPEAPIID